MDNSPDGVTPDLLGTLSYDDSIAYEDQISTLPSNDPEETSLAKRIGAAKLYLLSDTSIARVGKRKHVEEDESNGGGDEVEMDEDLSYRANALLLHGQSIAHLPTARLFAYAKHFGSLPMGLEWIDDRTCVLVFPSKSLARTAYQHLQKSATEEPDMDGFITAKAIPIALWPPEDRINSSLGKGQGLKGAIRMRWALAGDVKKKGAKRESAFYKKHGRMAGKEAYGGEGVPPAAKRQRPEANDTSDSELQKAQLDNELDQFLAEDGLEGEGPPSPPSKMRSDYIGKDGRTILEPTSTLARSDLASRITAPLPRRTRTNGSSHDLSLRISLERLEPRRSREGRQKGERRPGKMTQQELDDEMDEFWREKV